MENKIITALRRFHGRIGRDIFYYREFGLKNFISYKKYNLFKNICPPPPPHHLI
jgi:hypothetical protein